MNRAPAVQSKWKRVTAIGCSHGHLADPSRLDEVMAFVGRFKPDIRFDLGDLIDTAAFRAGANGSKDETAPIGSDKLAAAEWIRRYQPTHITWGNHDHRLVEQMAHHKQIIAECAGSVWRELQAAVRDVGAKQVAYLGEPGKNHLQWGQGFFHLGGVFWTHGTMYNQNALRDHAEMFGGRVVMAHLHAPEEVRGRVIGAGSSFCVGALADIGKMTYADRNRSKAKWGAGIVFGEMNDKESHLWLASARPGEPLRFPPGC